MPPLRPLVGSLSVESLNGKTNRRLPRYPKLAKQTRTAQRQSAVALVLVIAHHRRALARQGRAIRGGRSDRLDPWFLVVGE